jgi:hypothetical protein
MAAEFAHLLGLDLHCLFVEDEALLALAELPFAREIQLPSHKWSRLDAGAIEAEIRQMALQARRLMDEIIRDVGVSAEFQVLRGDPATCIAAVCQTGDIVVVAENDAPTAPATHSLTRLHIGAHESATSILLLPARLKARHGAIVAMLTDTGDPALDMAGRLAALAKEDLVILLPEAAKSNTAQRAEASVKDRAQAMGLPPARINVRFVHDGGDDDTLHALVGVRERLSSWRARRQRLRLRRTLRSHAAFRCCWSRPLLRKRRDSLGERLRRLPTAAPLGLRRTRSARVRGAW